MTSDFLPPAAPGVLDAMTSTLRRAAAALVTAALAGCSAGCSVPPTAPAPAGTAPGVPVVLRFGDRVATATLADTPESRQLAAMLPVTVDLRDVWGQAKSGRLPHTLTVEGSTPVRDPAPGGIYFWPSTEVIAVYYDDLGQAVPDPGLVRLGTVDTGMEHLAGAGRRFTVRIERISIS